MKKRSQTVVTFIAAWFAVCGIVRAEGYLTSVGSGADKIPVVVVKGTPYEMGKKQGELIKQDARSWG